MRFLAGFTIFTYFHFSIHALLLLLHFLPLPPFAKVLFLSLFDLFPVSVLHNFLVFNVECLFLLVIGHIQSVVMWSW